MVLSRFRTHRDVSSSAAWPVSTAATRLSTFVLTPSAVLWGTLPNRIVLRFPSGAMKQNPPLSTWLTSYTCHPTTLLSHSPTAFTLKDTLFTTGYASRSTRSHLPPPLSLFRNHSCKASTRYRTALPMRTCGTCRFFVQVHNVRAETPMAFAASLGRNANVIVPSASMLCLFP